MKNFYKESLEELLQSYKTDAVNGLTHNQAHELLKKWGPNHIERRVARSLFRVFIDQFLDPLIYLLIGSAAVIFFAGDKSDAFIILGILLLNAIVGTVQEGRIAVVADKIQKFKKTCSMVIRDGQRHLINDECLVPGDIIIVQDGEYIPADARLIQAYDLTVDESSLTGESEAVIKFPSNLEGNRSLHDQTNMIFMGSFVQSGTARAVVVATGHNTQWGSVKKHVTNSLGEMPLRQDLSSLLHFILWLILGICTFLFTVGLWTGKPFGQLLAALVALFICVVPQGLPMIMTMVLVSSSYALAKRNLFAKRLQATEALGRVEVVVIDKTGTLTRNELMVTDIFAGETLYIVSGSGYLPQGQILYGGKQCTKERISESLKNMCAAALLLDRSEIVLSPSKQGTFSVKGNPTEAAMRISAQKIGYTQKEIEKEYRELFEIPFGAKYQYHVGFYEKDGEGLLLGIGSPEVVMSRCSEISSVQQNALDSFLKKGLRVVAVCSRVFDISTVPHEHNKQKEFYHNLFEEHLTLLGFYGIIDGLRSDAHDIVGSMKNAGIRVVMATGDNSETARHMAIASGILETGDEVIDGKEFQNLSDEELLKRLDTTTVFARVLPQDKLRLVHLFQQKAKITAMIGDGVNDAPALVEAHLGIAMGNTGSEVAKEAADIILLDDVFGSITEGIEQGRHIFLSFKRVIIYFFTSNFSEVIIMLCAIAASFPLPLMASHILWLNLVSDGFLDTSLALEPRQSGLLKKQWTRSGKLISSGVVIRIMYQSSIAAGVTLCIFWWYLRYNIQLAQTMTMVTLTACETLMALNCRSLHHSLFEIGLFSNRWLAAAVGSIATLLMAILYTSIGNKIFKVVPLGLYDWAIIGAVSLGILLIEEIRKKIMG